MTFTITLARDEDGVVVAECLAARANLGLPLVVVTKQIDVPA